MADREAKLKINVVPEVDSSALRNAAQRIGQALGGGAAGGGLQMKMMGGPALGRIGGMAGGFMGGAAGALTAPLGGMAAGMGSMASAMLGPINQVIGGFGAAAQAIGLFVSKSNPLMMEKFNLVMNDTLAVVGQRLEPMMEILTEGLKLVGDVLNSILPDASAFKELFGPIKESMDIFRDTMGGIADFIKDTLTIVLKTFGIVLKAVLLPFQAFARMMQALFGWEGAGANLKSSTGAAVRNVSFGNMQSVAQEFYKKALMSGSSASKPQGEYQGPLAKIVSLLDTISSWVTAIGNKLNAFNPKTIARGAINMYSGASTFSGPRIGLIGGGLGGEDSGAIGGIGGMLRQWAEENARRGKDGWAGGGTF